MDKKNNKDKKPNHRPARTAEDLHKILDEMYLYIKGEHPDDTNQEGQDILFLTQLANWKGYSHQYFSDLLKSLDVLVEKKKCTLEKKNEILEKHRLIRDIIENRIVLAGLGNALNPTLTIFCLTNKYNWSNTLKTENNNTNTNKEEIDQEYTEAVKNLAKAIKSKK